MRCRPRSAALSPAPSTTNEAFSNRGPSCWRPLFQGFRLPTQQYLVGDLLSSSSQLTALLIVVCVRHLKTQRLGLFARLVEGIPSLSQQAFLCAVHAFQALHKRRPLLQGACAIEGHDNTRSRYKLTNESSNSNKNDDDDDKAAATTPTPKPKAMFSNSNKNGSETHTKTHTPMNEARLEERHQKTHAALYDIYLHKTPADHHTATT